MSAAFCRRCQSVVRDQAFACPACGFERPTGGWPRDPLLGAEVVGGQYRVLRRLGAGGFGVVYEVETVVGGLRRALKLLAPEWVHDDDMRDRFINEALVLEQVNHPNVARCYAAGQSEDGRLYLLLELVEGPSLEQLLREQGGSLAPARAVRIARQIASGLVAAHANGVVHRDLKPANVLVVDAGEPGERIKLIDFGIAKVALDGPVATQNVLGTPQYMAPEQFLPGSPLDARVDLWQLGATLHALLTAAPPYRATGDNAYAILAQQQARSGPGPAPSDIRPELGEHPALDQLVARLLSTSPSDRPGSAVEVCEALARIEHPLAGGAASSGSEALLEALCSQPSEGSWWALCRYLSHLDDSGAGLSTVAERSLAAWPDALRKSACGWWEEAKKGRSTPAWPLVRSLDLSGRCLGDADVEALAANPMVAQLRHLKLGRNEIGNRGAEALARSPHLGGLVSLELDGNRISSAGAAALAASGALGNLRRLVLAKNGIGAKGAEALAEARLALEALDLGDNDVGPGGAAALARGQGLARLRLLSLRGNRIGPDGVAALAVSTHLQGVEHLDLTHNGLGPAGAAALALSAHVGRIRDLRLAQNGLGREGLQLLLASTKLEVLEALDLSGNEIGPAGAMLFASSHFGRRSIQLGLAANQLGDAGLATLLGAPHLAGLRALDAAQNEISEGGAALLAGAALQLEALDLSLNPIGARGAAAVAEALGRMRLRRATLNGANLKGADVAALLERAGGRLLELSVCGNPLGPEGAERLAAAAGLASLAELDLSATELGSQGAELIFASPHLAGLRRLSLASNAIGDRVLSRLVATTTTLPRLETLSLADNGLGPESAAALAVSPLAARLAELDLAHNRLGDRGAEILARGGSWPGLHRLDLAHNELGWAGAAALLAAPGLGALHQLDLSDNALTGLTDFHSLGAGKAELLEESFGHIAASGADFAERFYEELFARYPSVRPLFARVSINKQQQHLLASLVHVVDHLREPDRVHESLKALGQRHWGYGVLPSHYYAVASTLLDTIREVLGEHGTEAVLEAWSEGIDAICQVMMSAERPSSTTRDLRRPVSAEP